MVVVAVATAAAAVVTLEAAAAVAVDMMTVTLEAEAAVEAAVVTLEAEAAVEEEVSISVRDALMKKVLDGKARKQGEPEDSRRSDSRDDDCNQDVIPSQSRSSRDVAIDPEGKRLPSAHFCDEGLQQAQDKTRSGRISAIPRHEDYLRSRIHHFVVLSSKSLC